jgi:putative PIN family toxin of toxin-antitoxin system
MPLRATLDTNVFVSGLISRRGAPREIIDAWVSETFTLVTSPYLISKLRRVLTYPRIAGRLQLTEVELQVLFHALSTKSAVTAGALDLPGVTRDPKDDPLIACAGEGNADYVVSGDEDILVLESYDGVKMINPAQFVVILQ